MLTAYPTELPTEALTMMLDKVRGKAVETSELVRAAWCVVGYGLGKGMPAPTIFGLSDETAITEEGAIMSLLAGDDDAPQGILIGMAISIAIKIAMQIIKASLS